MKIKNILGISVAAVSLFLGGRAAFVWKSPGVNRDSVRSIYSCIHEVPHHTCHLVSMGTEFVVHYVEHAGRDCVNPSFPSVHITAKVEGVAWMQIVRTDSSQPAFRKFIDTVDQKHCPAVYPFYTRDQDFYDAPCWDYTLFQKPLSFCKAHAYAVLVDPENKTLKCVGGISWGYELSFARILPKCSAPCALTQYDWEQDCELFSTALPDYIEIRSTT